MAFSFLSSDFFAFPGLNSLPTPPATPILPATPLPSGDPPTLPSSASSASQDIHDPRCASSSLPAPSAPLFYPKSFIYSTPINPNTFGAVRDPGYTSLHSSAPSYYFPPSPAKPMSSQSPEPSPCDKFLHLYKSGDLDARKGMAGMWELECVVCKNWVKTSVPNRRPLVIASHFANLESHGASSKCVARPVRASSAPPELSPRKVLGASSVERVKRGQLRRQE
ncbi:hypothetical protein C8R46DRAFT_1294523 [Mycena filopes]|nr:hypothetical protein C8R46DRAFT_1294523 [Mycena filopes]